MNQLDRIRAVLACLVMTAPELATLTGLPLPSVRSNLSHLVCRGQAVRVRPLGRAARRSRVAYAGLSVPAGMVRRTSGGKR